MSIQGNYQTCIQQYRWERSTNIVGVQVSLDLYGKSVRAGVEIVKKELSLRSEIVLARFDCICCTVLRIQPHVEPSGNKVSLNGQ